MLEVQTHIALGAEAWGPDVPLSRLVPSCRLAPPPALQYIFCLFVLFSLGVHTYVHIQWLVCLASTYTNKQRQTHTVACLSCQYIYK